VIYFDCQINWNSFVSDIKTAVDAGFNVLNLGFYLGVQDIPGDALLTFMNLPKEDRDDAFDYAHSKGAKIMISMGGATDYLEPVVRYNNPQAFMDYLE